jgi:serine/threonine-protein kinase
VFVARDEELGRTVAVKQLNEGYADNASLRARFVLEAEITGNLEHPGVVPVYSMGSYADGRPYYAMRFIQGDTLRDAIRRHDFEGTRLNVRERSLHLRSLLIRFVEVCNTIAYAHSRGVLHRDIKPHNVILGRYGETLIIDWGLAKVAGQTEPKADSEERMLEPRSASGADVTHPGSALGSPAYMSPEQAAGDLERLGPTTDIYSLGATLYDILTGHAPQTGRELHEILGRVQRGEFPHPRQVKRDVPRALEAVCLKAMALDPADRYRTVSDLARDIERWLADEPVSAWQEPRLSRIRRWMLRHQTLFVASVVTLAMALAFEIALLTIMARLTR